MNDNEQKRQKEWETQSAQREAQREREREEDASRLSTMSQEVTQLTQQIASVRKELGEKEEDASRRLRRDVGEKEMVSGRVSLLD